MVSRDITIINNIGLHARPATFFIQKANTYKSSIWLEREERKINAKSLLGIVSLGLVTGAAITLCASGSDAENAVNALEALLQKDLF